MAAGSKLVFYSESRAVSGLEHLSKVESAFVMRALRGRHSLAAIVVTIAVGERIERIACGAARGDAWVVGVAVRFDGKPSDSAMMIIVVHRRSTIP